MKKLINTTFCLFAVFALFAQDLKNTYSAREALAGSVKNAQNKEEQKEETGTLTDARDGKTYRTIKIGDQWWMAENLAWLPSVSPASAGSATASYYYVFGYNGSSVSAAKATGNYQIFGALYNWPAALTSCPAGWHLPADKEWSQLTNYLAGNGYNFDGTSGVGKSKIGKSLATDAFWQSSSETGAVGNNPATNNSSGFSALPGSSRYHTNGDFFPAGIYGFWWSSTGHTSSTAWYRTLFYNYASLSRHYQYGKESGFSVRCIKDPDPVKPGVETGIATDISQTTATFNGDVTSEGGAAITARGFYWSTSNETPGENDNEEEAGNGSGKFSVTLTGLPPGTTIYYRAFATNSIGTSEGSVLSFNTVEEKGEKTGTLTDTRDGKTYRTVKIGAQWWMAENLAWLPSLRPFTEGGATDPRYYVYGYDSTNVTAAKATENYQIYGVLYNWPAAMDGAADNAGNPGGVKGACPEGWHLPSDDEWTQLENYLSENGYNYDGTIGGGRSKIGKSLAAEVVWQSSTETGVVGNNLATNNSSGFSALPGGSLRVARDTYSGFVIIKGKYGPIGLGDYGHWWSSTESPAKYPIRRYLRKFSGAVFRSEGLNGQFCSIRCVRD
jgi:uncharacterized protein (TIGR02145 family)